MKASLGNLKATLNNAKTGLAIKAAIDKGDTDLAMELQEQIVEIHQDSQQEINQHREKTVSWASSKVLSMLKGLRITIAAKLPASVHGLWSTVKSTGKDIHAFFSDLGLKSYGKHLTMKNAKRMNKYSGMVINKALQELIEEGKKHPAELRDVDLRAKFEEKYTALQKESKFPLPAVDILYDMNFNPKVRVVSEIIKSGKFESANERFEFWASQYGQDDAQIERYRADFEERVEYVKRMKARFMFAEIKGESLFPILKEGAKVPVEILPPETEYALGELIVFYHDDIPIIHFVVDKFKDAKGTWVYKTSGTNPRTNPTPDPFEVPQSSVLGRADLSFGTYAALLEMEQTGRIPTMMAYALGDFGGQKKYIYTDNQKQQMVKSFQTFIENLGSIIKCVYNNYKTNENSDAYKAASYFMQKKYFPHLGSTHYIDKISNYKLVEEFNEIEGFNRKADWISKHLTGIREILVLKDVVSLVSSLESDQCSHFKIVFEEYSKLQKSGAGVSGVDLNTLKSSLSSIISIIRNRKSMDAHEHPGIELADGVLSILRKWLELPASVSEQLAGELLFGFKGVKNPEDTFASFRRESRSGDTELITFKRLFEFLYYPSYLTPRRVHEIIQHSKYSNSIKKALKNKALWDHIRGLDVSALITDLTNAIKEHIRHYGFSYAYYASFNTLQHAKGKLVADSTLALYALMANELKSSKNPPSVLRMRDRAMERLINGHLTPTDIQTMGSHKLFYVHSLPIPENILAAAKKAQANEYHASWNKPEIYATHMVELLISQAGMMPGDPFGRGTSKVEYYFVTDNPNAPQCFYFRHHIDFYKYVFGDPSRRPSGGEDWWSWDLLLMGRYHFSRMMQEPTKNLDYYSWARGLKNGFMHGRCPDYWTYNQKVKYYSRLYDIIAEWNKLNPDFEQDKFKWLRVKIGNNPISLNELLREGVIDRSSVTNIIKTLEENIERNSNFEFDFGDGDNRDDFIEKFLKM